MSETPRRRTDRRKTRSGRTKGQPRKLGPLTLGRWLIVLVAAVLFVGSAGAGYAYQTVDVPQPEDVATSQYSTIYYADGKTELARLGTQNRVIVPLSKVPAHVRYAVLAAENRSFYTDPGFSPTGILRAAWNNLTSDSTQGGSTITQQYVKNAFLTQQRTLDRKLKELILSVKVEQRYSKDEILGFYLNTIYFGRGAWGVEAAAETYFGKPVDKLTVAEGAVLAASIASPARYDPQNHPEAAKSRWSYVLDGMVKAKWLTTAERQKLKYPTVQPAGAVNLNNVSGPEGLIVQRVKDELAKLGIDENEVYSAGLKIVTTIRKGAQDIATQQVQSQLAAQPKNLVGALVSIDPQTGGVMAYYGGPQGTGFDYAQAYRQPGSSFKPFTLVAALENGFSVYSLRNGSSPQTFPDRTQPVRNSGGDGCSSCTIKQAMTNSYNTTFYGLAFDLGGAKVKEAAYAAGIPKKRSDNGKPMLQDANGVTASAIGIGQYEVTPQDQASAFATFAAGGVYRTPHFVAKVTDSQGEVVYQWKDDGKQTIPADVANDVTFALDDVAQYSNDPLDGARPVAAKTGTVQLDDVNNKDAWMVGYTPQVSTAVWIGSKGSDALINAEGRIIYGAGVPGKIWQAYMNLVLSGAPVIPLPTQALITATTGATGGPGSGTTSSSSTPPPSSSTSEPPPSSEPPAPPPSSSEPPPAPSSSEAAPSSSSAGLVPAPGAP